jgi:RimJ/RimL family protein N-acetyltransferase
MANVFVGKRVRLRAFEPPDEALFRYWERHDPDGGRLLWEINFPAAQTEPEALETEEAPAPSDNFPFSIATLDAALVGAIHIQSCDLRNGTFSYGIALFPPHQGKGYGSEAIRLVLRHYFRDRGYQKCTIEVYSFNEASIRLHERLGFTLEARLRRMTYTQGTFHDALRYGITREEFEASDKA